MNRLIDYAHAKLDQGNLLIPTLMVPLVIIGIIWESFLFAVVWIRRKLAY